MCAGEVVDLDLRGIPPSAGSSTGDDLDFVIAASGKEMDFGSGRIDGVEDDVGLFSQKDFVRGAFAVEGLPNNDLYFRIDCTESVGEDGGFGFANGFGDGMDLSVHVGDAKVIEIDEGEFSDSRSCQSLADPGADTSEPNDHGMAGGEFLER